MPRSLLVLALVLTAACGSKTKTATTSTPVEERSRDQIEDDLRAHLATIDDPCAKATWIRRHTAETTGLEREVAEPLNQEHAKLCAEAARTRAPDTAPIAQPIVVTNIKMTPPCTRTRADTELRRHPETPRPITSGMIEAVLGPCVTERIATCQAALATSLDAAITCWSAQPWTDLPPSLDPATLARTTGCLRELKGIAADLATCPTLAPTSRASCVSPYLTYTPSCPPLDVLPTWKALPGYEEIEKVHAEAAAKDSARTQAEKDKEAKRLAAIALESDRCHGHTTLDLAMNLKKDQKLVPPKNCHFQVFGKVVDRNNVFVQLVDPISAGSPHLLRTRETFADSAVLTDRTATFDGTDEAEMADGSKRVLAVFKLDPPAKKPKR